MPIAVFPKPYIRTRIEFIDLFEPKRVIIYHQKVVLWHSCHLVLTLVMFLNILKLLLFQGVSCNSAVLVARVRDTIGFESLGCHVFGWIDVKIFQGQIVFSVEVCLLQPCTDLIFHYTHLFISSAPFKIIIFPDQLADLFLAKQYADLFLVELVAIKLIIDKLLFNGKIWKYRHPITGDPQFLVNFEAL